LTDDQAVLLGNHADGYAQPPRYSAPLTKTEIAYRQIRQEIVEGVLRPDTVLDQEALAERLGLSTTPIREALRLLETENLVISRRHRNTVVAPLDLVLLEETYAVRLVLDPMAVSLAATNAREPVRAAIRAFFDTEVADSRPSAALHANRRLHRMLYAASGNSVLTGLLDTLWDHSDRYRMVTLHKDGVAGIAGHEHSAIIEAVLAGDAARASALMRDHVADSLARVRSEFSSSA
jgi:DNA-binding GntR family transcriptional regulator